MMKIRGKQAEESKKKTFIDKMTGAAKGIGTKTKQGAIAAGKAIAGVRFRFVNDHI